MATLPKLSTEQRKLPSLKPKHRHMAALIAAGYSTRRTAQQLGVSEHAVYIARHSPLFKLEVERLTKELADRTVKDFTSAVMEDGDTNTRFLKGVRDGDYDSHEPEIVRFRLDASKTLFDRQMPKRLPGSTDQRINITFSAEDKREMDDVCVEIGEPIEIGIERLRLQEALPPADDDDGTTSDN